jgi:hypothetical protein
MVTGASSLSLTLLWDAIVRSFLIPIGPVLLLTLTASAGEATAETELSTREAWAQTGITWGSVYAAYMGGRSAANLVWPALKEQGCLSERQLLVWSVISTSLLQVSVTPSKLLIVQVLTSSSSCCGDQNDLL